MEHPQIIVIYLHDPSLFYTFTFVFTFIQAFDNFIKYIILDWFYNYKYYQKYKVYIRDGDKNKIISNDTT